MFRRDRSAVDRSALPSFRPRATPTPSFRPKRRQPRSGEIRPATETGRMMEPVASTGRGPDFSATPRPEAGAPVEIACPERSRRDDEGEAVRCVMKCNVPSWRFGLAPNATPSRPGPRSGPRSRPARSSRLAPSTSSEPVLSLPKGQALDPGFPLCSIRGDKGGVGSCHEMSCFVMVPPPVFSGIAPNPDPGDRPPAFRRYRQTGYVHIMF